MALEDQHGVRHVLAVSAVEEAELLLAMGGIVGGIEIEQDLTALADLVATETNELLPQPIVQAYQFARGRRVLPATPQWAGRRGVLAYPLECRLEFCKGLIARFRPHDRPPSSL